MEKNTVRAVGRAASVTVAAGAVILTNTTLFTPIEGDITWSDVAAESAMVLLASVWILILDPNSVRSSVYYALWAGSLLVLIGNLQDVLDEFYEVDTGITSLENVATPLGMGFITVGLLLWLRSNREAYVRLAEAKELYEQLSRTDALTKLYNSRYYYEQLRLEIERSQRYDHPLSLLFLDIDDFKAYNDAHGHVAGDKVLKAVGSVIKTALRENDSGYRYGGEEFTVLLPETDGDEAYVVAERIRRDFADLRFEQTAGQSKKTISIGISELKSGDDAESLTRRADKAMYQAKLMGKNVTNTIA